MADNHNNMKITSGQITQFQDIDSGTTVQNVPWQVTNDEDVVVHEGNQVFPLIASADEIRDFLTRVLVVYQEDLARFTAGQEGQAALENAEAVAGEISNISITN